MLSLQSMFFRFGPKSLGIGVKLAEKADQVRLRQVELCFKPGGQGLGVGSLFGAEAAVAGPVIGRAQSPATRLGHRSQARQSPGHQNTDISTPLALQTHAVSRQVEASPVQISAHHAQQLVLADGAALKLQVHGHMVPDGGGGSQGLQMLGCRINHPEIVVDIGKVTQGLDAPGSGAGADGYEKFRILANFFDLLQLFRSAHRPPPGKGRKDP